MNEKYKNFCVILVNLIIILLIINIVLFAVIEVRKMKSNNEDYKIKFLKLIYTDWSIKELIVLSQETWSRPYSFEPYVQFKERVQKGKYVNVYDEGFRKIKNQCEWPINENNFNIFVFGGSTTFGYGVLDEETIPSYLQEKIKKRCQKVCVYNFGQAGYFSTQERIQFEQLILKEQTPKLVLFIDGINDLYNLKGIPLHSNELKRFMDGNITKNPLKELPLSKAIFFFDREIRRKSISVSVENETNMDKEINGVKKRMEINRNIIRNISKAYGIKPYFIIQPVPAYKYNLKYHTSYNIFNGKDPITQKSFFTDPVNLEYAYSLLEKDKINNETDIIWLDSIQENKTENLYVGAIHYTKEFSEEIAIIINNKIQEEIKC